MSMEHSNPSAGEFEVVDEKRRYVRKADLPPGARNIIFNKDELIAAKDKERGTNIEDPKIHKEPLVVTTPLGKDIIPLQKKVQALEKVEEIRKKLGAENPQETERITETKVAIQEELSGINPQLVEDYSSLINVLEGPGDPLKEVVPELSEEWKGFDKQWFKSRGWDDLDNRYAYKIMGFSEKLAGQDPEYRKKLSDEVYKNEGHSANFRDFKGVDPEGRLIKNDGTVGQFAYYHIGASEQRFVYEKNLLEDFAKEKGFLN